MMKKFTSFLAMMLLFVCGATAQTVATLDTETNLFTSVDQFSSPWTEGSEGGVAELIDGNAGTYWHSQWTAGAVPNGTHYFQVEVAELPEEFGFSFTRRNVNGNQITEWGVYGVPSDTPNAAKDDCTPLAEISTPCASATETLNSPIISSKGFTIIRFYCEGTVGINGGQQDKGFFHLAEFGIHPTVQKSAIEVAIEDAHTVYQTYSVYAGAFTPGTAPGNYSPEAVAAFEAALEAALILDMPEAQSLTTEEIQKIADDIKATYDAIAATRVPFAMEIAEGYYYITAALDFTSTTTTEDTEDPETGEMIPGETITEHHTKAIYTDGNNGRWADINREDANYLWKVVKGGDKKYHLINCQNDNQFTKVATSANITLSVESDSLVVFDYAAEGMYNIRLAAQAEHDYFYLHCGGHGGGAGKQGNLVGWCPTYNESAGASEWQLEAVDEATALAIIDACSPAKKIKAMEDEAASILAAAPTQIKIALDQVAVLDENTPLVTEAAQLYSPQTTNDTQRVDGEYATDEQVMGFLLDGNTSTYWHSAWEGGNRPNGADYIEVSDIDAANVAFKMTRRAVANDHITSASVYGYDEARTEATKEEGELLAQISLPFGSNTETLISEVIPTKGHSVIRIYEESTTPTNRGYWHMSEFQMYPATVSQPYATTQAEQRAAELKALEAAIEAWKALDLTAVTQPSDIEAQYKALASAWTAWTAVYVNPTDLRSAMKATTPAEAIKIGNNPGQWANSATLDALKSTIEAATAYDATGKYTPAESEKHIAALAAADSTLLASANKVQTGKWYTIRFGTEAEYEEGGWDATPGMPMENTAANVTTSEGLLNKVITVARHHNSVVEYTAADGSAAKVTMYIVEELDAENEASYGANVAFISKDDVDNMDLAMWRFVSVGDSAYALQNKATGLYIRTAGASGAVSMSVQPALFNTSAIGYGRNLIKANAITGENHTYLHGERATQNLVTWNAYALNSNSCLYIEEAEDVTAAPANEYTMSLLPGQVQTVCYPVEIAAKDATLYAVSVEGTTVTLNPLKDNKLAAGKAAVMILGETADYDEEAEEDAYELCKFTHGTEFVAEADTTGVLRGTFVNMTIGRGNIWAEKNAMVVTKNGSNTVGANSAYVQAELDKDTVLELVIESKEVDAIQEAIANVSKTGDIYTADGKYVGRGNLNSVKAKGLYIVNGVKVLVK